ncbi:uncharacterized protein BT62DRAFT_1004617 [Guyanagaster necrorhizus]|uniref:Uncharacterized protein n=1 Tax=Guyanagaster necrorhizus TaxID=856835 RepID=A0A9P7VWF2_9AGAR|nr:uncharacterized protein BT62DRAFT_1004617 [Guyanagaster necrorhizus MCA 3950]KAG7447848.1 hypothetical protein BT62DRAFT_1004617 [Guyanagaster necrorhizus MCA 3950]
MPRFQIRDFDIQILFFLASILSRNAAISAFLLLILLTRTIVWPIVAPLMPSARLAELESALKATYPLLEMQDNISHPTYNSRIRLKGFEREVLRLFKMRLNIQRRLILGGYSWKEYFCDMWSIWRGAQACRERVDVFRVELEARVLHSRVAYLTLSS